MFCSVEQSNGHAGDQVFNKKTTTMIMFLNSLNTFMSVLVSERERERETEIPFFSLAATID